MNSLILLSALLAADPVPAPAWLAKRDPVPAPAFEVVLAEKVIEPEIKHTAKPIVRPMRIPHTRHYPPCICPEMCLAQHLANNHGMTHAEWNRERLWTSGSKMQARHKRFHRDQPKPKVQAQECCPGGNCGRRRLFGRWR